MFYGDAVTLSRGSSINNEWKNRLSRHELQQAALCHFHFKSVLRESLTDASVREFHNQNEFAVKIYISKPGSDLKTRGRIWSLCVDWIRIWASQLSDLRFTCVIKEVHSGKALLWLQRAEGCLGWLSLRRYHWCSPGSKVTADRRAPTPALTKR